MPEAIKRAIIYQMRDPETGALLEDGPRDITKYCEVYVETENYEYGADEQPLAEVTQEIINNTASDTADEIIGQISDAYRLGR